MMDRARGACALVAVLAFAGCSKASDSSADANANASPTAVVAAASTAPADTAAAASDATPTPAQNATAAPTATAVAVSFADISGVNGAHEVTQLAMLGVVDPTNGAFNPGAPIKRREFIRWLVKADNALWRDQPGKEVRLGDSTDKPAFPDVPTSDPDFPYVQGMQNAGYSVGFPNGTFRPDEPLTREQMFAIKNIFDRGSVDPGLSKDLNYARNTAMPQWKDKASISKTYVAAIATGTNGGADSFARVYGASALFHPQEAVTRAQAALLVSVIGDHTFYGGATRTADNPPPAPTAQPN
jgi:hypothetical protein